MLTRFIRPSVLTLSLGLGLTCPGFEVMAQQPAEPTQSDSAAPAEHPLAPALKYTKASRELLDNVKDYQANFSKQELINGRMLTQQMEIKLRKQPHSVYIKYKLPQNGREILYVEGRNNNQILAHESVGLKAMVGTISLATNSPVVMEENRYPITMLGMSPMLDTIIKQWEAESQYGEIDVKFYPEAKLGQIACEVIESTHPQPRRQFRFHITRLYFDKQTHYPIRLEQFAFPQVPGQQPVLVEEYTFTNIQPNINLTEKDFDPNNPQYGF